MRRGCAQAAVDILCSVKDRIALNMITRAEQAGRISPGTTTLVGFLHLASAFALVYKQTGLQLLLQPPNTSLHQSAVD